tara:strand:- start:113 stop:496 length:384 start_codon:yes stop_codon:yes gene_type:complete
MHEIEFCRTEVDFWCPLCGTKNVTETGEITECEHFEGMTSMGEIVFDKSGILEDADQKQSSFETAMVDDGLTFEEACKKFAISKPNADVTMIDFLKSSFDDNYVLFYTYAPAPSGAGGFYLYHLKSM